MKKPMMILTLLIVIVGSSFAADHYDAKLKRIFIFGGNINIKLTGNDGLGSDNYYFQIPESDPQAKTMLSVILHAQSNDKTIRVYTAPNQITSGTHNRVTGIVTYY